MLLLSTQNTLRIIQPQTQQASDVMFSVVVMCVYIMVVCILLQLFSQLDTHLNTDMPEIFTVINGLQYALADSITSVIQVFELFILYTHMIKYMTKTSLAG
jgi:hypothetical protein